MGESQVEAYIEDITSNRAEVFTFLEMINLTTTISILFNLHTVRIKIYCDNMEALLHPNHTKSFSKWKKRDADIKMEVTQII